MRNGCLKVSRTLTLSDLSFQLIDEKGSDKITKLRKFDNDFFQIVKNSGRAGIVKFLSIM